MQFERVRHHQYDGHLLENDCISNMHILAFCAEYQTYISLLAFIRTPRLFI